MKVKRGIHIAFAILFCVYAMPAKGMWNLGTKSSIDITGIQVKKARIKKAKSSDVILPYIKRYKAKKHIRKKRVFSKKRKKKKLATTKKTKKITKATQTDKTNFINKYLSPPKTRLACITNNNVNIKIDTKEGVFSTEGTMLFFGIRKFTKFCSYPEQNPEAPARFMKNFFDQIFKIIRARGGNSPILDGDGFYTFFPKKVNVKNYNKTNTNAMLAAMHIAIILKNFIFRDKKKIIKTPHKCGISIVTGKSHFFKIKNGDAIHHMGKLIRLARQIEHHTKYFSKKQNQYVPISFCQEVTHTLPSCLKNHLNTIKKTVLLHGFYQCMVLNAYSYENIKDFYNKYKAYFKSRRDTL